MVKHALPGCQLHLLSLTQLAQNLHCLSDKKSINLWLVCPGPTATVQVLFLACTLCCACMRLQKEYISLH